MARRSKDWWIAIGVVVVIIIVLLVFWGKSDSDSQFEVTSGDSNSRLGVIEIIGPIFDSKPVLRTLEQFEEQGNLKGILLRIDSPGGVVAPSQEIYEEIQRVRDRGMPVVASLGTTCASGGYYIACAADSIVANPGTVTGSIGVYVQWPVFEKLLNRWGIEVETFKSGPFKDTGSPFRSIESGEKAWVQDWVDDTFEQFVLVVSESRHLPIDTVRHYATGRVYTGRQALEIGLVDQLGNFNRAVELLSRMTGIEGKPKLVYPKRILNLRTLLTEDIREWAPALWTFVNPFRYQWSVGVFK